MLKKPSSDVEVSTKLEIHNSIRAQLKYFYDSKKIPHILFYGSHGSGKKTLLNEFLESIYAGNRRLMHQNILYSNCSHSKGIKHIREILKEYARSNVTINDGVYFKSVVLYNFEDLSVDGQSALRRVIESYSRATRFFVISHSKERILTPILSRLAHIHIPLPIINGLPTNLHKYHVQNTLQISSSPMSSFPNRDPGEPGSHDSESQLCAQLDELLSLSKNNIQMKKLVAFCEKIYNAGYSAMDLVEWMRKSSQVNTTEFSKFAVMFCKVRPDLVHERILLLYCLNFRSHGSQNISFL
jgi:hypothetical protein